MLGSYVRATLGFSALAEATQLKRPHLYRALSAKGNPELATFAKVLEALKLRLHLRNKEKILYLDTRSLMEVVRAERRRWEKAHGKSPKSPYHRTRLHQVLWNKANPTVQKLVALLAEADLQLYVETEANAKKRKKVADARQRAKEDAEAGRLFW